MTNITDTTITIEWEPPLTGSPVFYYVVEHSDPDDILRNILRTKNLTANSYILDRMRAFTTYIIRVSVRNSVSDQDAQNAAQRIMEISNRTKEGRKIPMCKIAKLPSVYVLILNLNLHPLPPPPLHPTLDVSQLTNPQV